MNCAIKLTSISVLYVPNINFYNKPHNTKNMHMAASNPVHMFLFTKSSPSERKITPFTQKY